jgi:hypothetical protein
MEPQHSSAASAGSPGTERLAAFSDGVIAITPNSFDVMCQFLKYAVEIKSDDKAGLPQIEG